MRLITLPVWTYPRNASSYLPPERAYGDDHWFPADPTQAAQVAAWLSTAANEVAPGPNALRLHYKFGRVINVDEATAITNNLLTVLNQHLEHHDWLATDTITIADIAIYPYIALANEGNVDLTPFLYIENWLGRIEMLNWFVAMPGLHRVHQ